MDINLNLRHLDRTTALTELAQRRSAYAFARFGDLVRDIDLRLSDVNGPRGGCGIACLARLRLVGGGDMLVESKAVSPELGIVQAITRLAGRLRRQLSRRKGHG